MEVGAERGVAGALAAEQVAGTWAHVKAACEYNADLGERVLWCAGVDWQRTRQKLGCSNKLDLLIQAALCWEWWAVIGYRLSHWAHARLVPDLGRHTVMQHLLVWQQGALLRFCNVLGKVLEGLSGARISGLAEIGPGLMLAHTGSCGIGTGARIGHTFTMYQDSNVMAGRANEAAPVLGDNVTLFSGARVSGPVRVGDEVRVGANALVLHDLPAGCLAIGLPARPFVTGEHAPPYPASAQVRDLVATLTESGQLREIGPDRYLDAATGVEIILHAPGDGAAGV